MLSQLLADEGQLLVAESQLLIAEGQLLVDEYQMLIDKVQLLLDEGQLHVDEGQLLVGLLVGEGRLLLVHGKVKILRLFSPSRQFPGVNSLKTIIPLPSLPHRSDHFSLSAISQYLLVIHKSPLFLPLLFLYIIRLFNFNFPLSSFF